MVLPRNDIHYSIIIFMVGCVPVSSRASPQHLLHDDFPFRFTIMKLEMETLYSTSNLLILHDP